VGFVDRCGSYTRHTIHESHETTPKNTAEELGGYREIELWEGALKADFPYIICHFSFFIGGFKLEVHMVC
jgi:hypothetical protein